MEMGITESWERVTWILQERKILVPLLSVPWRTNYWHKLNETHQAHNSGLEKSALCLALHVPSNYE